MACDRSHIESDQVIASLPISQGGPGRHKCAACAYEKGLDNGLKRDVTFDISGFIDRLEYSQKGARRHKDPLEAYTLGFFHGLNGRNTHSVIQNRYEISDNMAIFGLQQVGKGLYECTFGEDTKFKHAISTVHVASGFELIVKSRIAKEHPYLIFEKLPKYAKVKNGQITIEDLLEHGHTITYAELPERLWVTTTCRIPNLELFEKFGKIRNQIIHFAKPDEDFSKLVYEYCFKVVEPLVNEWWDTTLLEFASNYDDDFFNYVFPVIEKYKLSCKYELSNHQLVKK